MNARKPLLKDVVQEAWILAYQEDTAPLEAALKAEGFTPQVYRTSYSEAETQQYPRQTRCMMGHRDIWKKIAQAAGGLTMIFEADFVPCVGMGNHPLPFSLDQANHALGYLYAGGTQAFDMHAGRFVRGHASCLVAYVINGQTARVMVEWAEQYLNCHGYKYRLFDCDLGWDIEKLGVLSWMPYRQSGEHGGIYNPEHKCAGLNPVHQSDVLWGRLHFLPPYANGSRWRFWAVRFKARTRGLGRLLLGRYLNSIDIVRAHRNQSLGALLRFSILRHFSRF